MPMSSWTVRSVPSGLRRGAILSLAFLSLLLPPDLRTDWAEATSTRPETFHPAHCNHTAFRVVIDVGHTREVPGALSARGIPEYDFNLRLAKQIEEKLIEAGS